MVPPFLSVIVQPLQLICLWKSGDGIFEGANAFKGHAYAIAFAQAAFEVVIGKDDGCAPVENLQGVGFKG